MENSQAEMLGSTYPIASTTEYAIKVLSPKTHTSCNKNYFLIVASISKLKKNYTKSTSEVFKMHIFKLFMQIFYTF